jgi:hypothetical protein
MATLTPHTGHHGNTPGGRLHARRVLLFVAMMLCAGASPSTGAAATGDAADGGPQITVREEQGVFIVAARFTVAQAGATAIAVLTDYEGIPSFMPDIRTSTVLERGEGRTIVEQEAVGRVMLFSKRVHLVLEIRQEPGRIRFRDLCGRSFVRYEGAWRIVEQDGRTTITYELAAKPAFDVPGFVLKRLLKRDAKETIQRLQIEMAARIARAVASDGRGGAR